MPEDRCPPLSNSVTQDVTQVAVGAATGAVTMVAAAVAVAAVGTGVKTLADGLGALKRANGTHREVAYITTTPHVSLLNANLWACLFLS